MLDKNVLSDFVALSCMIPTKSGFLHVPCWTVGHISLNLMPNPGFVKMSNCPTQGYDEGAFSRNHAENRPKKMLDTFVQQCPTRPTLAERVRTRHPVKDDDCARWGFRGPEEENLTDGWGEQAENRRTYAALRGKIETNTRKCPAVLATPRTRHGKD
jgi:hypothetical protein